MFAVSTLIGVFGLFVAPLFASGLNGALIMMIIGLALMGVTYGPLGTVFLSSRGDHFRRPDPDPGNEKRGPEFLAQPARS